MKSGMLIIAVLASVVAGAGGGYVAATMGPQEKPSNTVSVDSKPLELEPQESSAKDHSGEINQLRRDLGDLQLRMQGMVSAEEYKDLSDKYEALNTRLDDLKRPSVAANNAGATDGGVVVPADPGSEAFKEAVARAIEEKEAADRAEWQARQQERMKERMVEEKERVLTTMRDKLALTPAQEGTIGTILESYNTKRTELMERGRTAMQNGEQFDWQAERAKIETETQEAIKAELTLTQVSSFTELLGDNDVDDIGEERGGRNRGFGGGGMRPRGN